MTHLLRFTTLHDKNEHFFLCNLGDPWPRRPERRMIERTSKDKSEAKVFASEEDARTCLNITGNGKGWEVVPL